MTIYHSKRVAIFVESHEGFGHFNIVSQLTKKLQAEVVEVSLLSGALTMQPHLKLLTSEMRELFICLMLIIKNLRNGLNALAL